MMVWIKSDQSLARHPKLKQACRLLGLDTPTMIGHLHLLWWWACEYAPDGNIGRWDIAIVAEEAGWKGDPRTFIGALTAVGFLDDGSMSIHDWHEYSGNLKERREEHAEKMRDWRRRRGTELLHQVSPLALPEPSAHSRPQLQPQPARKGKHKLPADYPMTDAMVAWATRKGFKDTKTWKLAEEHERFCDYWHGNGKMMVDWEATWRNWIRRSVEYATANQQRGGRWASGKDQEDRPRLITDYSPNVEGQQRLEEIAKRNLPAVGGGR